MRIPSYKLPHTRGGRHLTKSGSRAMEQFSPIYPLDGFQHAASSNPHPHAGQSLLFAMKLCEEKNIKKGKNQQNVAHPLQH